MNLNNLFECWQLEVANKKRPGRRISLLFCALRRARKDNKLRFLFAFRLAQYLDRRGGVAKAYARRMQQRLNLKYAVDIDIGAQIGPGFRIAHLPGVVITRHVSIGRNFLIRQNCSIGIKTLGLDAYALSIGDNVSLGAGSCIVADRISIGDDVVIGAMSLVVRDIPGGMTFYNPRQRSVRPRE
ncbi:serine acetyltransferase [Pseudomonas sp. PSKL.D1]|uniref:serine acetyltransferase n=1 Tax=Pseudomonas sp. PSKL.D1 TaxID=3029060 RepID=UPI002381783A|nr:serine acetyltransferase [Pseudomonas sp. PSKL.D1]WDY57648.1 serine acetyltransferase [Pseudomonas sp. PSKL.D1]